MQFESKFLGSFKLSLIVCQIFNFFFLNLFHQREVTADALSYDRIITICIKYIVSATPKIE
jgi:hypothetical protein